MSEVTRVYEGFVYRSGSKSDANMTPRPEDDVSPDLHEAGLSTWRALESAIKKPKGTAQKIDLARLDSAILGCFQDEYGHVSIVPIDQNGQLDMIVLAEWAATRDTQTLHPLTQLVLDAVVEVNVRRPK